MLPGATAAESSPYHPGSGSVRAGGLDVAEAHAIAALVPISRTAFTRYAQSDRISVFARELYGIIRDQREEYLVFTYVADRKSFFYFHLLNHPSEALSSGHVVETLTQINLYVDKPHIGYVLVHPSAANFLADAPARAFEVRQHAVVPIDAPPPSVMEQIDALSRRFIYAALDADPTLSEWLARKDLIDPALKQGYRRIQEQEGRQQLAERIKAATPANPARLFAFYIYDGAQVCMLGFGQVLEDADPYTLRSVKGGNGDYVADQRFAYHCGRKIPHAHGPSFKCLAAYDNIHNVDQHHAFYYDTIIEGADAATFRTLGYSYARDRHFFYSAGTRLGPAGETFEIDVCGFLHTSECIFHYGVKLALAPATFAILDLEEHRRSTNPFIGTYLLQDKTGLYEYDSFAKTLTPKSR
jgi:hypothetical protein